MRLIALLCLASLLVPLSARGQTASQRALLRLTVDVADAELVVTGDDFNFSSPTPLLYDGLKPGRYEVSVYRDNKKWGFTRIDAGSDVRFTHGHGSRAFLSALIPGAGQFRDLGVWQGLVPLGTVVYPLARSLYFSGQAGEKKELQDSLFNSTPPAERDTPQFQVAYADAGDAVWLEEQTRDDYAYLTGYWYLGNILSAGIRRGPYVFELSGDYSVAARYRPASRFSAAFLSLLYPGLGQTRAGRETRGAWFTFGGFLATVAIVEAQRGVDEKTVDVQGATREVELEEQENGSASTEALQAQAQAQADLEGARSTRSTVLLASAGYWLINIVDAILVADLPPVPKISSGRAGMNLRLEMAMIENKPGLALSGRF